MKIQALCVVGLSLSVAAWGITLAAHPADLAPPKIIVIEGRREPNEAVVGTKAMHYLPFDVPEGITRLVVHKEFEHGPDPNLRNTVDLGIFDPRGGSPEKGPLRAAGFRGWQGGVPNDLIIAAMPDTCSPHAIPGSLPAGRWHLAQYFLKSTPSGLGYKYTITLYAEGKPPKSGRAAIPAYDPKIIREQPGWYSGNLHSHTVHSDGGRTLEDLITRCERFGFDFTAVTDHNSPATHYRFAEVGKAHPRHLLLFGDEFTSPGGHANIINQAPGFFFDFRMDPGDGRLPEVIEQAHRQHAFFTINHPYAPCTSCTWLYPEKEWTKADAIEVWNGAWTPDDRQAVDLWDRLLKAGRHVVAVGGTDYHRGEELMVPASRVYARHLSWPGILEGLTKGRVTLTRTPESPLLECTDATGKRLPGDTLTVQAGERIPVQVRVSGMPGQSVRFVWSGGEQTETITKPDQIVLCPILFPVDGPSDSYVRVELTEESGQMVALTNPIYLKRRR